LRKLKMHVDALQSFGIKLVNAVRTCDLQTIRGILEDHPDLVNAGTDLNQPVRPSDARAMRLVHLAVSENQPEILRLLVDRGANLNVRNAGGRLALHDCFELGHDDSAKILLDAGAIPDVCPAAAYGMHDRLEILNNDPQQVSDLSTGESPLGWSVYGMQPELARILFAHVRLTIVILRLLNMGFNASRMFVPRVSEESLWSAQVSSDRLYELGSKFP
jgi:Ankyrin repeats (3 copies)